MKMDKCVWSEWRKTAVLGAEIDSDTIATSGSNYAAAVFWLIATDTPLYRGVAVAIDPFAQE
jgi:hypothetical protein